MRPYFVNPFWYEYLNFNLFSFITLCILIICSTMLVVTNIWTQKSVYRFITVFTTIYSTSLFIITCILTYTYHNNNYFFSYFYCTTIDQLTLVFLPLITFLLFIISIYVWNDFATKLSMVSLTILFLFYVIINFLLANNILYFFFTYELLIIIVFFLIIHSGNNRGNIEALIFFIAWAIIGSLFVMIGVIYIITNTQCYTFLEIRNYPFNANEIYFLSICFFIGFGTKLALWPFWYWLPRAHVEVSTSLSIFLSCVLLKICLYGFLRLLITLNNEIICLPFIYCLILAIIDVAFRITTQTDLKAITAYSSVLHINLLVLLILLDSLNLSIASIIYIWAHSLTTASTFIIINLIEKYYFSRHIFEISGIFTTSPLLAFLIIWNLLALIGFPIHCFFWSLCWLILIMLNNFPIITIIAISFSEIFYLIIIFRFWLGLLIGTPTINTTYVSPTLSYFEFSLTSYILALQFLLGLQPNILTFFY